MVANPRKPRTDAYRRITQLSFYTEIKEQLVSGVRVSHIAAQIRGQGECLDIAPRSLQRTLYRLRVNLRCASGEQRDSIRELAQVTVAIRDLQRHIKSELALEERIGGLLPSVGSEMLVLGELLQLSAALKVELGIYARRGRPRSVEPSAVLETCAHEQHGE